MLMKSENLVNIVIEEERIVPRYQPIISVKKKKVIGVEALSRGINPFSGELIPPYELFSAAQKANLVLELDRLCRKKAFEGFRELHEKNPELILTINIDASIIDQVIGSNHLANTAHEYGISPNNVAIEIIESKVTQLDKLRRFTETYRNYGFLIALDDVGAGHSNLDRIPLLKPDIIKIDRFLVSDVQHEYYKLVVLKSLIDLAHKTGALVIAEGVENEAESLVALENGSDFLQGFHLSRAIPADELLADPAREGIENLSRSFKKHAGAQIYARKKRNHMYRDIIASILKDAARLTEDSFEDYLRSIMEIIPDLECLYVLDELGMQVSETLCKYCSLLHHKSVIYQPAPKGTDHSLKNYFLAVGAANAVHITESYVSFATGNICQTISALFTNQLNKRYILCLDIVSGQEIDF